MPCNFTPSCRIACIFRLSVSIQKIRDLLGNDNKPDDPRIRQRYMQVEMVPVSSRLGLGLGTELQIRIYGER